MQEKGLAVCFGFALHTYGSTTVVFTTVPVSPLLAKNSPPDCFLNAQTLTGSSPFIKYLYQRKRAAMRLFFFAKEQYNGA